MTFLLDSNVYIEARNHYYNPTICPDFWEFIEQSAQDKQILSIDRVLIELNKVADDLTEWSNRCKSMFLDCNDESTPVFYKDIVTFVNLSSSFSKKSAKRFIRGTDPWSIARAKSLDATVVSLETRVRGSRQAVKVPNICDEFDVNFCNPFEMLEKLGVKLYIYPNASIK